MRTQRRRSTRTYPHERVDLAIQAARRLIGESQALGRETVVLRDRARVFRLRREAERGRAGLITPALGGFTAYGYVEHEPVAAVFGRGELRASESLRERAQVLVAMGETFGSDDERGAVRATLIWPPDAVLLTVLRAMSRVATVELELPRQRRSGSSPSAPDDSSSGEADAATSK